MPGQGHIAYAPSLPERLYALEVFVILRSYRKLQKLLFIVVVDAVFGIQLEPALVDCAYAPEITPVCVEAHVTEACTQRAGYEFEILHGAGDIGADPVQPFRLLLQKSDPRAPVRLSDGHLRERVL